MWAWCCVLLCPTLSASIGISIPYSTFPTLSFVLIRTRMASRFWSVRIGSVCMLSVVVRMHCPPFPFSFYSLRSGSLRCLYNQYPLYHSFMVFSVAVIVIVRVGVVGVAVAVVVVVVIVVVVVVVVVVVLVGVYGRTMGRVHAYFLSVNCTRPQIYFRSGLGAECRSGCSSGCRSGGWVRGGSEGVRESGVRVGLFLVLGYLADWVRYTHAHGSIGSLRYRPRFWWRFESRVLRMTWAGITWCGMTMAGRGMTMTGRRGTRALYYFNL